MPEKWFVSDTHFCHDNILRFTDTAGRLIRGKLWQTIREHDETLIENWNRVVKPHDKVYHLGDVFVGVKEQSRAVEIMSRLNGRLALFLGNHDHIDSPAYKRFRYIDLWSGGKFRKEGFVCSHIPLRPDQMRSVSVNVHGHLHQNLVRGYSTRFCNYPDKPDPSYINVCVEHTEYRPINMDEVLERIKSRSGH